MSKNILYRINPFIKFIIMLLMLITITIAKSFYLLIIIGIIDALIVISADISVNKYIEDIKKIILWLIFILIAYIIIIDKPNTVLFLYKIMLCFSILDIYFSTSKFDEVDSAINLFLSPLKIFIYDINNISFDITLSIYFIINLIKLDYDSMEYDSFVYSFAPKYIIARIIYTNNKIIRLQNSLLLKFYKVKKYSVKKNDIIILIFFILLFVIAVCKEVF